LSKLVKHLSLYNISALHVDHCCLLLACENFLKISLPASICNVPKNASAWCIMLLELRVVWRHAEYQHQLHLEEVAHIVPLTLE
jgi:hypothetical protein